MNTIELIEDAVLFGGSVPNKRAQEVRDFLSKFKSETASNVKNIEVTFDKEDLRHVYESVDTSYESFEKWYKEYTSPI